MREGFKTWLRWVKEPRNRTKVITGFMSGILVSIWSQYLPVWWQVGFYVSLAVLVVVLLKGFGEK